MTIRFNIEAANPMWKGGVDADSAVKRLRPAIIKRDGKKCFVCGTTERRLYVHHRDENRRNNDISNLVLVCRPCHSLIHGIAKNLKELAKRKLADVECRYCKRVFRPRKEGRTFCSRACFAKMRPRKAPQAKCIGCGALFFVTFDHRRFCGISCYRSRGLRP
jgi:hypothetical protein